MPTRETAEYPKPKDAYEFEDIVWDIFKRKWNDPRAQRYGRSGQEQQGVDVYGQPQEYGGRYVGVQCKRYDKLDKKIIYEEITKAEKFKPPLAHYIFATTVSRDGPLQEAVRMISDERKKQEKFTVEIQFWDDLSKELAREENLDLLKKHFPNWPWQPAGIETTWTVPYLSLEERFVGRREDLESLHRLLEEHGRVGLSGMGGLAIFAVRLGRPQSGLNTLVFVAGVMALFDPPHILWDVGFQLSFMATLGLLLYADPLEGWFAGLASRRIPSSWVGRITGPMGEFFLFTLAAQLTTLPLILYCFRRLSLASLIANPLILPAQPPVMLLGGLAMLVGQSLLSLREAAAILEAAWVFPPDREPLPVRGRLHALLPLDFTCRNGDQLPWKAG